MKDLISTAAEIQKFCEDRNWQFCFIGGLALQFWGEQRLTKDVDLTLFTGFGGEENFIDDLIINFKPRRDSPKEFALRNRVVLLETVGGIGIDISLGAFPFEEIMIARSGSQEFLRGISLRICTAEDLIVLKAFADRLKDWADVEGVIAAQKDLNWEYIFEQLEPLVELKEEPEIIQKLQKLKADN